MNHLKLVLNRYYRAEVAGESYVHVHYEYINMVLY